MTAIKIITLATLEFCSLGLHRDLPLQSRPQTSANEYSVEWFELEGTFKIISFQPPCYRQGHLPLDQVAHSPIQPGLECFQGGGIHNLTGQPVHLMYDIPLSKFRGNAAKTGLEKGASAAAVGIGSVIYVNIA